MKKSIHNYVTIFSLIIVLVGITSCQDLFNNPLQDNETGEDLTLFLFDLNFYDTELVFEFVDYETGEVLDDTDVKTYFIGEGARSIVTLFGGINTEYDVSAGYLELYLDPNFELSASNPLDFEVLAYTDTHISLDTKVEITELGEKVIVVELVNLYSDYGALYKSANAYNDVEPFDVNYSDTDNLIKVIPLNKTSGNKTVYNRYLYQTSEMTPEQITMKKLCEKLSSDSEQYATYNCAALESSSEAITVSASNIADENLYSEWGFADKTKEESISEGEYLDSYATRSGLLKCESGLRIKINKSDNTTTGNGSFDYIITYDDGSELTGCISGSFEDLSTTGVLVEPLYYNADNPAVTVELKDNNQYAISNAVDLSSPCEATAEFTASMKNGLVSYTFNIVCSCDIMGLAYSGFGRYRVIDTDDYETFRVTTGGFSLSMDTDEEYELSVLVDDEYYYIEIDTGDLENCLLSKNVDGNYISEVTITGDDVSGYVVDVDVQISDKLCDRIASFM